MDSPKFAGVSKDDILLPLGQDAIGNIGSHHVAIGKSGIDVKTINTKEGFTKMDVLDAQTSQGTDQTFTGGLILPPEQYDLAG